MDIPFYFFLKPNFPFLLFSIWLFLVFLPSFPKPPQLLPGRLFILEEQIYLFIYFPLVMMSIKRNLFIKVQKSYVVHLLSSIRHFHHFPFTIFFVIWYYLVCWGWRRLKKLFVIFLHFPLKHFPASSSSSFAFSFDWRLSVAV